MKKRVDILLLFMLLFFISQVSAQRADTMSLRAAVYDLNSALVHKNTVVLKRLLHKKVKYAHSNGWVEDRKTIVENLYNGTINYISINIRDIKLGTKDNTGMVSYKGDFEVFLKDKSYRFKLKVLQIWQWHKGHWFLVSRQSEAAGE